MRLKLFDFPMHGPTLGLDFANTSETESAILFQSGGANMWRYWLAAMVAALALGGCMSSGTQVSDEQLNQLQKGKTTEAEVIARMGPPQMTQRSSDGTHTDIYSYVKVAEQWQSFVPVVGTLAGGIDTKNQMVTLIFDRNNVLKDWSTTGGGSSIATGLVNQK